MVSKLKLDHAGIAEILASDELAGVVGAAADRVAGSISESVRSGEPLPVVVDDLGVTGRRAPRVTFAVTLAHAAGIGKEAKYGLLTGAAAAAGLEVGDGSPDPNELVDYTTKAGKKRKATRAQVANWTRGSSS